MRKILFIKVNPIGTKNLYLDVEEKELMDTCQKSANREHYVIESKGAVSIRDLHEYLEAFKPTILHISGHGNAEGKLYFHDAENHKKEVSMAKFCDFIKNYNSHLKCIFLNACFSISGIESTQIHEGQAIIGMKEEVPNDTAVLFSKSFYTSLFGGKSIQDSFQSALGVVGIDGFGDESIPIKIGSTTLDSLDPIPAGGTPDSVIPRTLDALVSEENFHLVRAKRRKQKQSYHMIVGLIVVLCLGLLYIGLKDYIWPPEGVIDPEFNFVTLAGVLPMGLIKWIKEKLDGIDDSLMLLKMLENEISEFIESLKRPPVERVEERTAQYNDQFWRILEVNK